MFVNIDTSEFQRAVREHLLLSKRELSAAINTRMFYLLLRVFTLLPPSDPQAERTKIKRYLTDIISQRGYITKRGNFKPHARNKQLQRVHLIVQAQRKKEGQPGLYGGAMKQAAAKFKRRAQGSVGYLRSSIVKAIKQLQGNFSPYGKRTKKNKGKEVGGNSAAIAMARLYGVSVNNVSMHKGSKGYSRSAAPGINPTAASWLSVGVADDQVARVDARYAAAFTRAYADETTELKAHIAETMQAVANQNNAVKV